MVVTICKYPEFLNEEGVDKTVEPLEIISLTLFLKFLNEINAIML